MQYSGLSCDVSIFNRVDGSLISTARSLPAEAPGSGNATMQVIPAYLRHDRTVISGSPLTFTASNAPATGLGADDTIVTPRILFGLHGEVAETLAWIPSPRRSSGARQFVTVGGASRNVPAPAPQWNLSLYFGEGLLDVERPAAASADPATFQVTRQDIRGGIVYARSYGYTPVPYSNGMLDTLAARAISTAPAIFMDGALISQPAVPVDAATLGVMRGAMQFPDFQPPVRRGFVGEDGTLWLLREQVIGSPDRWLVLDARGNPLGHVVTPANFRPAWSSGDTLWAVLPDADDVPWLIRYRLATGSTEGKQ
jgi:hypothetical protein